MVAGMATATGWTAARRLSRSWFRNVHNGATSMVRGASLDGSTLAWVIAGSLVGIPLLALLFSILNPLRLRRKHRIEVVEHEKLKARLLDYIKSRSGDKREAILIAPFWRKEARSSSPAIENFGRRVPHIVRFDIIDELVKQRHVAIPDSTQPEKQRSSSDRTDVFQEILDVAGDIISDLSRSVWSLLKEGLAVAPPTVRLTDSTFERMTHGDTGVTIVGGILQHNEGTFINSPPTIAGRDAEVSLRHVSSISGGNAFDPQVLDSLVDVFRREAERAPSPLREQMQEVASGIEREAGKTEPDQDEVVSRMRRASRIIKAAGTVFTASSEAVKAWGKLHGAL